jgi:CRISPR-associated protein Cmr5
VTRQQKWAQHAFERVQAKEKNAKYETLCMKAPSLIRQAGLVQALAFLNTRGNEGARLVLDFANGLGHTDSASFLARVRKAALPEYMALSRDTASLAVWFRRVVQAEPPAAER